MSQKATHGEGHAGEGEKKVARKKRAMRWTFRCEERGSLFLLSCSCAFPAPYSRHRALWKRRPECRRRRRTKPTVAMHAPCPSSFGVLFYFSAAFREKANGKREGGMWE